MLLAVVVVAIAALVYRTDHPHLPGAAPHPGAAPSHPTTGAPPDDACDVAWNPVCYEGTSYDNACHLRRSRGVTTGYTPGRCPGERQADVCNAMSPECTGQEDWDRYVYSERMKKDKECGCPPYTFKPVCVRTRENGHTYHQQYDNTCLAKCDNHATWTEGECPATDALHV